MIFSCLDALQSFAAEMSFSNCNDAIAECILMQAGADGAVARSSFVSSVSKLMLQRFLENMSEERELRLESSVQSLPNSRDNESLRRGLSQVFDCLDVKATHLVDAHQLIALLCLLSEGDMDSRLFFMIEQSSSLLGDIAYVKSMKPVIRAFFLFFDHLFPAVFYFKHVGFPRFPNSRPLPCCWRTCSTTG